MSSTAENLQEHENRGHRFARALLQHADEKPEAVRYAALLIIGIANDAVFSYTLIRRTDYLSSARRTGSTGGAWAFMAGVELAIEQHEKVER